MSDCDGKCTSDCDPCYMSFCERDRQGKLTLKDGGTVSGRLRASSILRFHKHTHGLAWKMHVQKQLGSSYAASHLGKVIRQGRVRIHRDDRRAGMVCAWESQVLTGLPLSPGYEHTTCQPRAISHGRLQRDLDRAVLKSERRDAIEAVYSDGKRVQPFREYLREQARAWWQKLCAVRLVPAPDRSSEDEYVWRMGL